MSGLSEVPVPGWLDIDELAEVDVSDESWRRRTVCGDMPMSVFFPDLDRPGGRYDYSEAEPVCARCPVALECLAAWLPTTTRQHDAASGGYVGRTTPGERVAIRQALAERGRSAA